MKQVLLIGLDGFDPVLTTRWMDDGDLPVLKSLAEKGTYTILKSTVPPFTYPAWSSILTGVNPGRHGIIDFAVRKQGSYSVEYVNSTYRNHPTIFARLSQAGKQVAAIGFPTTYPPEPVNGIMISGFDSPLAYTADRSFCYPPSLWDEIEDAGHAFTLAGIQETRIGPGWHDKAATVLRDTIKTRTSLAEHLLTTRCWDMFSIVFSESDTASHHFWAAADPLSPRHPCFSGKHSTLLRNVYKQLDSAVGRLVKAANEDARVIIVSDHGSGGNGLRRLSLNRLLEQSGLFQYKHRAGSAGSYRLAKKIPQQIGQWLFRKGPKRLIESVETRNRLSGFCLKNCAAFSDELNYFPSVWIHDDRFPDGRILSAGERDAVAQSIRTVLLGFRDPATGHQPVSAVHLREHLYHGPALEMIPDLVIELNLDSGYSYSVWNPGCSGPPITEIPPEDWIGSKGGSMNGSHRPDGILISNCSAEARSCLPVVEDIGVSILELLDLDTSGWSPDGAALFGTSAQSRRVKDPDVLQSASVPKKEYGSKENQVLEDRLRRLGYL